MSRPRPGIGTEIFPVVLILGCLIGSWLLIVSVHRRASAPRATKPATKPVASVAPPAAPAPPPPIVPPSPPPSVVEAVPEPEVEPEPANQPPPVDPTKVELARLAVEETEQIVAARAADRRAETLEKARLAAVADAERWKRREHAIRTQVDALTEKSQEIEQQADALAMERDVLARERDLSKAELAKAQTRSSFAVLPHRGPNGTWRRPIIIECANGTAKLQPDGRTFRMIDLSGVMGTRSNPLVVAIIRELIRAQGKNAPDGSPSIPYIFFVVRPDGIRPYYEARARLEPLGIAFGYELVPQDLAIDYPNLDNPSEWDGSAPSRPLPSFLTQREGAGGNGRAGDDPTWPSAGESSSGRKGGSGNPEDEFRWPTSPHAQGGGGDGGGGFGDEDSRTASRERGNGLSGRYGSGTMGDGSGDLAAGSQPDQGSGSEPGGTPGGRDLALTPGMPAPLGETGRSPGMPPAGRDEAGSSGSLANNDAVPNEFSSAPPTGSDRDEGLVPFGQAGNGSERATGIGLGSGNSASAPGMPPSSGSARESGRYGRPSSLNASGTPPEPSPRVPNSLLSDGSGEIPIGYGSSDAEGASGRRMSGSGMASSGSTSTARASGSGSASGAVGSSGTPPNTSGLSVPFNLGASGSPSGTLGLSSPLAEALARANPSSSGNSAHPNSSSDRQHISEKSLAEAESAEMFGNPGDGEDGESKDGDKNQKSSPRSRHRRDDLEPRKIQVPMEIVVACNRDGIVIHPGGYRLTAKSLRAKDPVLVKTLKGIVQQRQQVDPMIRPIPSVRYLVESGGEETYRTVRRQTVLSGLDWPSSLQVSDMRLLDLYPKGSF